MRHVLVTGGGGYIGAVLVPHLLRAGFAVTALDRFFFGEDVLTRHPRLNVRREDVRCLTEADFEGIDAVIDLAGISNDPSGERFAEATRAINHKARVRNARLARVAGVRRYILASTCSIYGALPADVIADEETPPNPQTVYASANLAAESDILPMADEGFCVVVLRKATVFGLSPRMRFDLAVNGMTYGAWANGRLPVMRDGTQWRPMIHVADTARVYEMMLDVPARTVSGRIFNVGSAGTCFRIADLAQEVAGAVPRAVEIEWYGDPDTRSYRAGFERLAALGWSLEWPVARGVAEIAQALEAGDTERTVRTITLDWYRTITEHPEDHGDLMLHSGLLDIAPRAMKSPYSDR